MDNKGVGFIEIMAFLVTGFIVLIITVLLYKSITFGAHTGIVIDKRYSASYVGYTSSDVDGNIIRIPTTYPQTWSIKIQKDNKTLWINVTEKEYNELSIGDCYNCQNR